MSAPATIFGTARQLAMRHGYHFVYPAANDPLRVTRAELEVWLRDAFEAFRLPSYLEDDTVAELAREAARHVAYQFVRRVPIRHSEIDIEAPRHPERPSRVA